MRKIKEQYRKMSISRKLYLSILLCLILPLFFVFGLINSFIGKAFRESQCEKELEVLKQSKPGVENLLNDTEMISRSLIGNDDVQRLLGYYMTSGELDNIARVNLNFYISEIMDARKYISSICIYGEDNILFQYGTYYEKEGNDEIPGLQERLDENNGKPVWEPARIHSHFIAGDENEVIVSLQRNINNLFQMVKLGTERISIKEEYLCSLYQPVNISPESKSYIYNGQGEIVSSTDKTLLGSKAEEAVQEQMTQSQGYLYDQKTGNTMFYYKIPLNEWTVVKETAIDPAASPLQIINLIIWIALFLSIVFGIIFSYQQKKSIINPIIKLSNDTQVVNHENFNIGLYTKNADEVGALNQNIIQMTARISELIDTVYKKEIHLKEAEILSLQSQINPHFLYNTLDTLRWKAMEHDEDELADQIEALSNLFRHVLNNGKEITTLSDEVKHLKNYLAIQKGRFEERIQIELNIDEQLNSCKVLKLILQPVVENAYVHGLERKVGKGKICVTIQETDGVIEYIVEDDGVGADEAMVNRILNTEESLKEIYALKNVKDRIQLKYGMEYGITFHSVKNEGTKVVVRFPKKEEGDYEGFNCR